MSGIPDWAKPGLAVICVRDFSEARIIIDGGYRSRPPALHGVYRVTGSRYYPGLDARSISLRGYESDRYFDLRGFKPAVDPREESEDVALFTSHLKAPHETATTRERADV